MTNQEIISKLTESNLNPSIARARLNNGDIIEKSLEIGYEIDDAGIYRKIGEFKKGEIPYGLVHRALDSSRMNPGYLMQKGKRVNNKTIVPFSSVVRDKAGQCLEKAMVLQLAVQDDFPSFIINGGLDKGDGLGFHAYNIVVINNKPYLIDTENPLRKDIAGNITHPYVAPIEKIENDRVYVFPEWEQGRHYWLA